MFASASVAKVITESCVGYELIAIFMAPTMGTSMICFLAMLAQPVQVVSPWRARPPAEPVCLASGPSASFAPCGGSYFFGGCGLALAWQRIAAIMAKAGKASKTWPCRD
jgi:hypothetical protein